jgi:hypothetical protein
MDAGENVTDAQIDANDTRVGMIAVGQTVVSIACVVCFISWLHRAYENMRALSPPHPRFGSGWAIGGWFVPFLNLVRPKQIINDVYNSGRPSDPPPAWLGLWWAAFIISGFLSRFAFRGTRDDSSLEALTDTSYRYLVADGFDVVAAVLAIIVVRTLSRNQEQRAETAPSAPDEGAAPLPWALPAQPPEASRAPERERPAGPAPLG